MNRFDCSRQGEDCAEAARIARELAPLSRPDLAPPPFTDLIWRAEARNILGNRNRRAWRAVAPMRRFLLTLGIVFLFVAGFFAVAPLIGPSDYPGVGFEVPLMALFAVAGGGLFLASGVGGLIYTSE
ncbi:MAG: hypothetical protein GY906_07355 [bacterium]|nr:hypothetical protein [bacterium]